MNQIASQNAPSTKVVVPHFVFGGIVWLVVTMVILFFPEAFTQHYFNPILLAVTHLLALGWITMIILGALYQLIPVIMEVRLYSELLALISFVLLGIGSVLLPFSFWTFSLNAIMFISGFIIVVAVCLFVINVLITANKSSKKSIEKDFISTSVIWLLFTVIAGLVLAINLTSPFLEISHLELLKLHAHVGLIGWFVQLIIGVSSKLLPMFMVSHNLNDKKLTNAYYLINTGLTIGIISIFFQKEFGVYLGVIAVLLGFFSYLSFLFEAYKKRIKKHLDIGMKQTAFSYIIVVIPCVFIIPLVIDHEAYRSFTLPMSIAYGSTIFIGFISSLIMGQTYKTLPFIIWLKVYRNQVGKVKLPLPKDLFSEGAANIQFWLFVIGFALFLLGVLVTTTKLLILGGIFLFVSAAFYNYNIFKIILHKPKYTP